MKDVIIICINGWSGGGSTGGMVTLKEKLQDALVPLGVPSNNIFRRSWNHGGDEDARDDPNTSDLLTEIYHRTSNPSYLGIIGHSFGGWAACRLSRDTNREPDFVGLIDPVFGVDNVIRPPDRPRGKKIHNWYQHNSINNGDPCTGLGRIPCSKAYDGVACGHSNVTNAINKRERYEKWADGSVKRVNCGFGKAKVLTSHHKMDDNPWIHQNIININRENLLQMIALNQQLQIICGLINRQ
ncbi:hypothetical protein MOE92_20920 [Bacillus spizizenii]|nr:hypothetical protein [Bacillus spizizenii]